MTEPADSPRRTTSTLTLAGRQAFVSAYLVLAVVTVVGGIAAAMGSLSTLRLVAYFLGGYVVLGLLPLTAKAYTNREDPGAATSSLLLSFVVTPIVLVALFFAGVGEALDNELEDLRDIFNEQEEPEGSVGEPGEEGDLDAYLKCIDEARTSAARDACQEAYRPGSTID